MVSKQREREIAVTRTVKQVEQKCPVCGNTFWGAKIRHYDSRACRNKANYERHAKEYRQQRLETYHRQKEQAAK